MKNVVFLQGTIPQYRIPFFDELSKSFNVTVIHSDASILGRQYHFRTEFSRSFKAGGLVFNRGLHRSLATLRPEKLVVMFDLHWISYLNSFLRGPKGGKILWGHRQSKSAIANGIRRYFLSRADAVIQYSGCHLNQLVTWGVNPDKLYVAHNTLSIANSNDTSPLSQRTFLFVGRLQKRKKVDLALRAFAESGVNTFGYNFAIVGDGPELKRLVRLAKALNIERDVLFHGEIHDDSKLQTIYASSVAYISPGAVGLSVIHSFAYGVPVVTHRFEKHGPEFSNISNNVNSLVYDNEHDLPQIMRWIVNHTQELAEMGKQAFAHFHEKRSMKCMVATFAQALS